MGGKEGSRGYLYQVFASTLEALTKEFWNEIYIEFKSENDKVDIALELDGKIVKTIQVKSSINLFSSTDIEKWLLELIDDFPSDEYSLYLIGACDTKANTLVKSLKKFSEGIEDDQSKETLKDIDSKLLENNVSIKVIPFESSTLESIVRDSLYRYVSEKGFIVKYEGLDLIAKGVEITFMLLSTNGKAIEKEEFDKKIFRWIEMTLGDLLNPVNPKAKHEIMFYVKSGGQFLTSINEINVLDFHGYKSLNDKYYNKIKELTNEISKIKLPTYTRSKEEPHKSNISNEGSIGNIFFQIGSTLMSKEREEFLELEDKRKRSIIDSIKDILGVDIDESFFFVGDLKEIKTTDFMNQSSYQKKGADNEIKKFEYIEDLEALILDYQLLQAFIDEMIGCSVLPLVIENTSEISDNDLTIKLYIPKVVKLFKSREYPLNDYVKGIPKAFSEKDVIIDKIFSIKPDSKVSVEDNSPMIDHRDLKVALPKFWANDYNDGYTSEDLYKVLEANIGQTIYEDDECYNVIEFDIKQLYAKEVKALRNILVIHSLEEDVKIKYKILSNKSDGSIEGVLEVKKNTN